VRLATKLGTVGATPLSLATVMGELFQTVIEHAAPTKDAQTLVKLFERRAGVAIAPQKELGKRVREPVVHKKCDDLETSRRACQNGRQS
jgi:hypothetical protein